jgi:hypothetical protein
MLRKSSLYACFSYYARVIYFSLGEIVKGKEAMTTNLQNAINKASKIKMTVKLLGARVYLVVTPQGRRYTVRFETIEGQRYGRCNCKAGAARMACYHLPKAALVDTGIERMKAH